MKPIKKLFFLVMFVFVGFSAFAFEEGFTLGLRSNFSGSYTDPHINEADKQYLGAAFMRGMAGFIMNGEAELTYIFDSKRYFNYTNNNTFGGLGLAFNIGVGQGFSGQISGSNGIEVYCRVYMTPVVTFGTSLKTMLLKNRLVLGFGIGGRLLADPQPTYELYTNLNKEQLENLAGEGFDFSPETGTLYIPESMMKKMNPLGLVLKTSIEYNQPVIARMDIMIGAYASYAVYKPGYVSLPRKLMENAKKQNPQINFERDEIKSFYMNNLDFGISLGLLFKV
ncbi:hypothetical protein [Treponema denticola]|uniref:hypothetical protein n=1 Tax=Treponema denticola TaxID=158 RepID=UPI0020A3A670|nr:hypothetical protein [Treponema denticola]UTC83360.1 hypothetical protein HGJ18_09100 [Treponema denticola]